MQNLRFSKKMVAAMIVFVSIVIILGVIWLLRDIYTEDKPNFLPKETRGEIREGIKENIAQPIAHVLPAVGDSMINAAYQETIPASDITVADPTVGWKTYKNDELGFEIKYPTNNIVVERSGGINIFDQKYEKFQSEFSLITIDTYSMSGDININQWIEKNSGKIIGEQLPEEVEGFTDRKQFKIGTHDGLYIDWVSMGRVRDYVFTNKNKIVVVEIIGADSALIEMAENIITSFK